MRNRLLLLVAILLFIPLQIAADDSRPLILVSNDDGINSEALKILAVEMTRLGDVVVAAPLHNSSGVGQGITYRVPIAYGRFEGIPGASAWWVDALPSTCVRWAIDTRMGGRKPDLVVSGINDGVNTGPGTYYSGTVGAAREGAFDGAVAIAVSMARGEVMDFSGAAAQTREIAERILELGKEGILVNINFPSGKIDESKPIGITTLTKSRWDVIYHDRESPRGGRYFWITHESKEPPEPGSDAEALARGEISVTPLIVEATEKPLLEMLREALKR